MKIAIIGNPGSGKSTLGLKLHTILGIPLYHLDQYFWLPGWKARDREEFEKIHHELCDRGSGLPSEALREGWIIEGVATRLFSYRAAKADVILFLDIPAYICFYRILKRAVSCFGREYFSSAKGCPEKGPSLEFLKYIWNFNRDKRPEIMQLLETYKNQKKIYVIKNRRELQELVNNFEADAL